MDKKSKRKQWHLVLLLDLCVMIISFLIAMLLRFNILYEAMNKGRWYPSFYRTILLFIIIGYSSWVLLSNTKGPLPSRQDPLEKTLQVIRNQSALLVMIILVLFVIHRVDDISRTVIAIHLILNVVFDVPVRFAVGKHILKIEESMWKDYNVVLVTDAAYANTSMRYIQEQGITNIKGKSLNGMKVTSLILANGDATKLPDNIAGMVKGSVSHMPSRERISEVEAIVVGHLTISEDERRKLDMSLKKYGVPIYSQLFDQGLPIAPSAAWSVGGQLVTLYTGMTNKCPVLGVNYSVSNVDEAVHYVRTNRDELSGEYICFSNVHTCVTAHDDPEYLKVQNGASVIYPDGFPIASEQIKRGYPEAKRVAGPDFMTAMFKSTMDGKMSHYFYGGSQETLDKLKANLEQRYPGIKIAGMYSPPFRPLTEEEDAADVKMINDTKADFVWIALGAPKQEIWMANHKGKINGVMFGIGAGLDFHAGTINRAPKWVQKIGLEWFYRLLQDPGRLIKRYLGTNIRFLWLTRVLREK